MTKTSGVELLTNTGLSLVPAMYPTSDVGVYASIDTSNFTNDTPEERRREAAATCMPLIEVTLLGGKDIDYGNPPEASDEPIVQSVYLGMRTSAAERESLQWRKVSLAYGGIDVELLPREQYEPDGDYGTCLSWGRTLPSGVSANTYSLYEQKAYPRIDVSSEVASFLETIGSSWLLTLLQDNKPT